MTKLDQFKIEINEKLELFELAKRSHVQRQITSNKIHGHESCLIFIGIILSVFITMSIIGFLIIGNKFENINVSEISYVTSILVCRDNIGTTSIKTKNTYLIDYNILKLCLSADNVGISDILELISGEYWLPEARVDFNVKYIKFKIDKFSFLMPAIVPIEHDYNIPKIHSKKFVEFMEKFKLKY